MSSRVKADSGDGFGLRVWAISQSSCSNSRISFEGGAPRAPRSRSVSAPSWRFGRDVLGVGRVAVVLVGVVRVPALRRAEVELEALAVAGRDHALQIRGAELDGLLAHAAFL